MPAAPRTWLKHPSHFGTHARPAWKQDEATTGFQKSALDAAQLQHEIALTCFEQRADKGWSTWSAMAEAVAPDTGLSAYQLRAVMRGEARMTLHHALSLGRIFNTPLLVGRAHLRREVETAKRGAVGGPGGRPQQH